MVEPHDNGSRLPSRLIAIGASAGGVQAINDLVGALPKDIDAAVLVVLHMSPTAYSALPQILARNTELAVCSAVDGQRVKPGTVYVAPPDRHLVVEDGVVRVNRGPWEHGLRPAIDTLFRSVARTAGTRAVGVVLSGALDDGAAGLLTIKEAGGVALVQDPHEAAVPDMPLAALASGATDERLTVPALAQRLVALASEPPPEPEGPRRLAPITLDTPSGFVCPDCGGTLFDVAPEQGELRCRVGHAWTPEGLHTAHYRQFESALWTALRVLEEDIALQERIAARARSTNRHLALARIERRLDERQQLLKSLRELIESRPNEPEFTLDGE